MPRNAMLPGLMEPMTPAEYVRLRREAQGLSIAQAAKFFYSRPEHRADVERNIVRDEIPGAVIGRDEDYLIKGYAGPYRLDPAVYRQLRDEPPEWHPTVCRGCGCTPWQACICADGEDCTIGDDHVCTKCQAKMQLRRPRRKVS